MTAIEISENILKFSASQKSSLFSNVLAEAISASKFPFQSFVVVDLVRKLVYFPN